MNKNDKKTLFGLFIVDVLITLFFAIFAIIRESDTIYLFFAYLIIVLLYNIETMFMLLSCLYLVPIKYKILNIIGMVGNICMTTFLWCGTIQGNLLFFLLVFALFCNMIYSVIYVIVALLLKYLGKLV